MMGCMQALLILSYLSRLKKKKRLTEVGVLFDGGGFIEVRGKYLGPQNKSPDVAAVAHAPYNPSSTTSSGSAGNCQE